MSTPVEPVIQPDLTAEDAAALVAGRISVYWNGKRQPLDAEERQLVRAAVEALLEVAVVRRRS